MRRLICRVLGHGRMIARWEPWTWVDGARHRWIVSECERCGLEFARTPLIDYPPSVAYGGAP